MLGLRIVALERTDLGRLRLLLTAHQCVKANKVVICAVWCCLLRWSALCLREACKFIVVFGWGIRVTGLKLHLCKLLRYLHVKVYQTYLLLRCLHLRNY